MRSSVRYATRMNATCNGKWRCVCGPVVFDSSIKRINSGTYEARAIDVNLCMRVPSWATSPVVAFLRLVLVCAAHE